MTQMSAGQVPGIPASGQFRIASVNLHGGISDGDDTRLRRQLAMLADAGADVWALLPSKEW